MFQVWDQVKFKEAHEQAGKAGMVTCKKGEQYTVTLDDGGAQVAAIADDLELLGR